MTQVGDDCYFFYNSICSKGATCPFRHVEEAKTTDAVCKLWRQGQCVKVACPFRHGEVQSRSNVQCYWETQPSGCTKPRCQFLHTKSKTGITSPALSGVSTMPTERGAASSLPPPPRPPSTLIGERLPVNMPPTQGPPHTMTNLPPGVNLQRPPAAPGIPVIPFAAPGSMLHPPPGWIPPHQGWMPPTSIPPPIRGPYGTDPRMPHHHVEPVIVNLNSEESDHDHSPHKTDSVRDPDNNILDYFLLPNRKSLVRPRSPDGRNWSPSPERDPYYRRSSLSPRGRHGSQSPERAGRRRSTSTERSVGRRRSHSMDRNRSQSPDRGDNAHRRRSRSPDRRQGVRGRLGGRFGTRHRDQDKRRDLRDRLGGKDKDIEKPKGPALEEIKAPQGPKIVSLKKDKDKELDTTKTNEEVEEKCEPELNADGSEVKSLEEIYRERALQSMMTAKRKKVLEMKAARWSGKGLQNESENNSSQKEEKDSGKTEDAMEEEEGSDVDIDLDADVDIELGERELEDMAGGESSGVEEEKDASGDEKKDVKESVPATATGSRRIIIGRENQTSVKDNKPTSVKARLGLKGRLGDVLFSESLGATGDKKSSNKQTVDVKRTIQQRLGTAAAVSEEDNGSVRKGVIRLNRTSIKDRLGMGSVTKNTIHKPPTANSVRSEILLLPRITIQQNLQKDESDHSETDDGRSIVRRGRLKRLKRHTEEDEDMLGEEEVDDEEEYSDDDIPKRRNKSKSKKDMSEKELEESRIAKKRRKLKKKLKRLEEKEMRAIEKKRKRLETRLQHGQDDEDEREEASGDEENSDRKTPDSSQRLTESAAGSDVDDDKEGKEVTDDKSGLTSLDETGKRKTEKTIPSDESSRDSVSSAESQGRKINRLQVDDMKPDKEPSVHVTFGGDAQRRKLIRLNRTSEQKQADLVTSKGDSSQKTVKTFKREQRIYQPPALKRTGGPVEIDEQTIKELKEIKQKAQRELIDYGEIFVGSKKAEKVLPTKPLVVSKPVVTAAVRPTLVTSKLSPQKPDKKSDGSLTVKTFAEIMAEKKRKRLQKFDPILYEDIPQDMTDSSSAPSVSKQVANNSTEINARLSPPVNSSGAADDISERSQPRPQSQPSSNVKQTIPTLSSTNNSDKLSRWKKRKSNPVAETNIVTSTSPVKSLSSPSDVPETSDTMATDEEEMLLKSPDAKLSAEQKRSLSVDQKPSEDRTSAVEEKKGKMSDSFLDLESELLNMDDGDVDLDLKDDKDHDELMRELDELLA